MEKVDVSTLEHVLGDLLLRETGIAADIANPSVPARRVVQKSPSENRETEVHRHHDHKRLCKGSEKG